MLFALYLFLYICLLINSMVRPFVVFKNFFLPVFKLVKLPVIQTKNCAGRLWCHPIGQSVKCTDRWRWCQNNTINFDFMAWGFFLCLWCSGAKGARGSQL